MKRIWSIEEQVFVDPASGLTFSFTSEPTELDDTKVVLHVDGGSGRRVTVSFERNGQKTGSDIVPVPTIVEPLPPGEVPPRDGHPAQDDGLAASLQL